MWGLTTLLLFHMPYIISNNVKGFPIISIAARSVCAHLFADRFPLDLLRLVKLLYVMIVQRLICLCKTAKSISWSRRVCVCVWCVGCCVHTLCVSSFKFRLWNRLPQTGPGTTKKNANVRSAGRRSRSATYRSERGTAGAPIPLSLIVLMTRISFLLM